MASSKRRRAVLKRMADLQDDERRQLYKRAANMRRASQKKHEKPKHRKDYADPDEDDWSGFEKRRRRYKGSLRQWAVALLEDDAEAAVAPIDGVAEPTHEGLVLFATGGGCRVLFEDGDVRDCLVAPDLAASQRSDLAVGDRVELTTLGPDGAATIVGVLPRTSVLSRPDAGPGGQRFERVIAANVDRVVVVASARQPSLRTRLLDRYLIAADRGGADVAIALTKIDLLREGELDALVEGLQPYRSLGVPLIPCSSTLPSGLDELLALLRGSTAVLVGQSGVGKSSLLNALEPELALETRETGHANKGRHTTAASTLYRLAGDVRVIDTPGVRQFGLWALSRDGLRQFFHEFDTFALQCRYGDCAHVHEPGCAVRSAVDAGILSLARYDSYRRLYQDQRPA